MDKKLLKYDEEKYYKRNDNVYYNIRISNTSTIESKKARYLETRLTPIIGENLKDYYCTVARFKVAGSSIPIFIFQTGDYTVTLVDTDGTTWTTSCQWVTNTADPASLNYVWTYEEWAQSVTTALLTSYNSIPALIRPSAPPFVIYDPQSQLFSLCATSEYNSSVLDVGKTQIWMNVGTFSKFEYWSAFFGSPTSNLFANVFSKGNGINQITAIVPAGASVLNASPAINGITYYVMTQEQKGLFLLSDFDSLVITSATIPLNPEQYGSQDNVSTQNQQFVLTDFQPDIGNSIGDRGYLIYTPFVYRWFDVPSDTFLTTLDLQIFWKDIRNVLHPILLYYNDVADIKLLFKKKYKHVIIDKNL